MIISICAPSFDPFGAVSFAVDADTDTRAISRRVNRAKTLDGQAVANDAGYTAADRTFSIVTKAESGRYESLERLLKLYPRVIISTPDGVFSAIPQTLTQRGSVIRFVLLVMEAIS